MKTYIGAKIIQAEPMDKAQFLAKFRDKHIGTHSTYEGYKVIYPDGYVSWSPKETFEIAYREVTQGEKELMEG